MPYKSDKVKIVGTSYDRRVKLDVDDKEQIKVKYMRGLSLRQLGSEYGVDKRTIQFIVKPEMLKVVKAQFKERRKDGRYYDKDKQRDSIKDLRRYKNKLYKEGKIE